MNGLYAIVKRYETPEVEFADWVYRPDDHDSIYDRMMGLTGNDHEISADAASWCEIAVTGEIYEFREGEIEILDIQ